MQHWRPVQLVKINMIQAVDISRDVAVMVYDQIPKCAQRCGAKLFVMNIHKLANCAACL
jgi:hypothetical protein